MQSLSGQAQAADWREAALAAHQKGQAERETRREEQKARERQRAVIALSKALSCVGVTSEAVQAAGGEFVLPPDEYAGIWAEVVMPQAGREGKPLILAIGPIYYLYAIERQEDGAEAWFGPLNTRGDLGGYLSGDLDPSRTFGPHRSEEDDEEEEGEAGEEGDVPFTARERVDAFLKLVGEEEWAAEAKHPPLTSHHEAYAVIREELEEYWEQVRLKSYERDPSAMLTELVQTAAMCARAAVNLGLVCLKAEGQGAE